MNLAPTSGPLSLLAPLIDDAYTVYWDGQKLGGDGDPDRHISYQHRQRELLSIPAALATPGEHVLALRVWDRPLRAVENAATSGGLRGPPLLAERGTAARLQLLFERTFTMEQLIIGVMEIGPFSLIGILSLLLYFYSRPHREYLWIGLALLFFTLSDIVVYSFPLINERLLTHNLFGIADVVSQLDILFILLAAQWLLGLQERRDLRFAILITAGAFFLVYAALVFNGYVLLSSRLDKYLEYGFVLLLPCLVVFLWIAIVGIRTLGREAWVMLSPSIMTAALYLWVFATFGRTSDNTRFLVYLVLQFLVPVSVLAILAYRFLRQWREHQRVEGELQQAQAVQSLLVPERLPQTPGYRVEGTYLPASQVGGDFYQVLPLPHDGLIVVLGDVSGKGLQAAMVVSMAVGAVRAIAKETTNPAEILARSCARAG